MTWSRAGVRTRKTVHTAYRFTHKIQQRNFSNSTVTNCNPWCMMYEGNCAFQGQNAPHLGGMAEGGDCGDCSGGGGGGCD